MKFIDKKGKLFGVINVFDLFVLLMLALSIFFVYKWVRIAEDPSWVKVKYSRTRCIAIAEPHPYIVDLVKEGDESYNDDGLVVARIEKVLIEKKVWQPTMTVYTAKEGEKLFFSSDKSSVSMTMTVQLDLLSFERKGYLYAVAADGSTPIQAGLNFRMKTKKYSLHLVVREVLNTRD